MIRTMSELFSILQAVNPDVPVLMDLGDGKSHDIEVEEEGSDKLVLVKGHGQPFSYTAGALMAELRLHRPYYVMVYASYEGRHHPIEAVVYDGETLHLRAGVK